MIMRLQSPFFNISSRKNCTAGISLHWMNSTFLYLNISRVFITEGDLTLLTIAYLLMKKNWHSTNSNFLFLCLLY